MLGVVNIFFGPRCGHMCLERLPWVFTMAVSLIRRVVACCHVFGTHWHLHNSRQMILLCKLLFAQVTGICWRQVSHPWFDRGFGLCMVSFGISFWASLLSIPPFPGDCFVSTTCPARWVDVRRAGSCDKPAGQRLAALQY